MAVDFYQQLVTKQEQLERDLVESINPPRKLIVISSLMTLLKNTIIINQLSKKYIQLQASQQVELQSRYQVPGSIKDLSMESFLIARLAIRLFVLSSSLPSESYACHLLMTISMPASQS